MNKYDVVLVDDNKDLLEVMTLNLQDDFNVQSFMDPQKALGHIIENRPDAVILDYHLKGFKGSDLHDQIKSADNTIPVLYLTGDCNISQKSLPHQTLEKDILLKPISSVNLICEIKNKILSNNTKHLKLK